MMTDFNSEMDRIFVQQIVLEEELRSGDHPHREIYLQQLDFWVKDYVGGYMTFEETQSLLDDLRKELKVVSS